MAIRLATTARTAAADAVVDLVDAGAGPGTLKIYTGAQPATGDTEGSGTLLATIAWADPAFGAAAAGVATATDPAAVTASGTGTAASFVVEDSTGANVFNGTVTATGGGGDLQVASTAFATGITVDITAFTYTQPGA